MPAKVHRYRLEADYGPAELFAALRAVCAGKKGLDFEFDWMKRRLAVTGPEREAVEAATERLLKRVHREGGNGLLLAGKPLENEDRWEIPVGIMLQTPDVYLEAMAQALAEQGIKGIQYDMNTVELEIPAGMSAKALGYQSMVQQFPLPAYIRIVDLGAG